MQLSEIAERLNYDFDLGLPLLQTSSHNRQAQLSKMLCFRNVYQSGSPSH